MKEQCMGIKKFSKEIKIPYLIHFTRWESIDGIIEYGLLPKILIEDLSFEISVNDELRLDGHEDSVSLSIAFPNYKMFYRYRMNSNADGWVVLVIHPSVLWEYECAFCKYNAADSRISCVQKDELKSLSAFKSMYAEFEGDDFLSEVLGDEYKPAKRIDKKLKSFDPTDSQAEILVFDIIPAEKIIGVVLENNKLLNDFKGKYPDIRAEFNKNFFSSRNYVRLYRS